MFHGCIHRQASPQSPHKVFTPVFSVHFFQSLGSLNRLQNCKLITLAFCGDCCQNISGFHSFVSFHSKSFNCHQLL